MTTVSVKELQAIGRPGEGTLGAGWIEGTPWGPIMMGAACAIGIQFIFTVLGIALGASASDASTRTMSTAAGLWWLITGTIALFAGGHILGRFTSAPRGGVRCLTAITMWAAVAIFGFLVVWSGTGMLALTPMDVMWTDRSAGALAVQATEGLDPTTDRAVRAASWWAVFGLLMGVAASVLGSYTAMPGRMRIKPVAMREDGGNAL